MQHPSEETGKIARSAGSVSIAVMCSRVLGLIREQVFAALFGAGFAYDAFVVAFRIPNLLRDLFGEGALSAAFVTVFSDYNTNKGENETWRLAGNVMTFFTLLLSIITLIGIWQSENIVRLLVESHFEQNGAKHRKIIGNRGGHRMYVWIIKNNFPEGFQVLCHNCNMARSYPRNGGICPHQKQICKITGLVAQ